MTSPEVGAGALATVSVFFTDVATGTLGREAVEVVLFPDVETGALAGAFVTVVAFAFATGG